MPDWKQIVRKKLQVFGICPPEFTEELAAHLEDSYEALRGEGLPREQALQYTVGQIEGRCRLRIVMWFLQEELMTGFIPKVVLPGVLTAAAARVFYCALAWGNISPRVSWLVGGQLPRWWWCLLPLCATLGAFLSQRKGGPRLQRMAASLLPSAILCTLALIVFLTGFTMSGFVNPYQSASAHLESLGIVPPGFGVIPAVLSLLGARIAEVSTRKFSRLA
jgi:hypothetical protein